MSEPVQCMVASDFNAANLTSYLDADQAPPAIRSHRVMVADVGAAAQAPSPADGSYVSVVWFRAERVCPAVAAALQGRPFSLEAALGDVDRFAEGIRSHARRAATVLVASWVMPPDHRGFGLSAMNADHGVSTLLLRLNLRLVEQLAGLSNVHVLDTARWLDTAGPRAFDPRLWYLGKIPYANAVFRCAAREIKAAVLGIAGGARKVVIVDLDNTLWGGLVGEIGWQALRLGGHDAASEAYVDFQHALKSLSARGVLLAIASKNDRAVALGAIRNHPEMVLREGDFAALKIDWHDKAENVADVLAELNLGPESAVFIDDHPAERARVREALPAVLVPEWPASPLFYPSALMALDCFDTPALTDEDRGRRQLYQHEAVRAAARQECGSFDDWLHTLDLRVHIAALDDRNCPRATQLLNKTNQMNLSTRRLSAEELRQWAAVANRRVWTFRVADRFGDSGVTGVLSLQFEPDAARIVDFVVSCRVIGRRIEETMLHQAVEAARAAGVHRVVAHYDQTPRNGPCQQFLDRSGLMNGNGHTYSWDVANSYPAPSCVAIERALDA